MPAPPALGSGKHQPGVGKVVGIWIATVVAAAAGVEAGDRAVGALSVPALERGDLPGRDVLYRCALVRVRKPEVAEDLMPETLLAAWRSKARFQSQSAEHT